MDNWNHPYNQFKIKKNCDLAMWNSLFGQNIYLALFLVVFVLLRQTRKNALGLEQVRASSCNSKMPRRYH